MQLDKLTQNLRGELIQPGDQPYDAARKLYNAMIDRRPRFIVRCSDVADVIAAVQYAREHELLLAVRGGGHNGGGLGSCDNGLVIDLSAMKGVRVDPSERTARVNGGSTWGEQSLSTLSTGHVFQLCNPPCISTRSMVPRIWSVEMIPLSAIEMPIGRK